MDEYNYLWNIQKKIIEKINSSEIIEKLYFQEIRVPTIKEINTHIKKLPPEYNKKNIVLTIKKYLAKLDNYIPLYDIINKNLHIISSHDVYQSIVYEFYRFPDKMFIEKIKRKYLKLNKLKTYDLLKKREIHKIELMLNFLEQFDENTLYDTYLKIFYYSNKSLEQITLCTRKSFLSIFKHIKPYYDKDELINLAKNMNIIRDYHNFSINKICKLVRKNDIPYKTLLTHYEHIYNFDMAGLIKYYTIQGSYFLNKYLRKYNLSKYPKNTEYENTIKQLYNLITGVPKFKKPYIVYRFIQDDKYLINLKIGDKYIEKGFMSTTRDPFYKPDLFKFGFILLRIQIPKNINGVALCVETVSNFSSEEEIIFAPNSEFELINIDENVKYYTSDPLYQKYIKKRYEFKYIKTHKLQFLTKNINSIKEIKFGKENTKYISIEETIINYEQEYLDTYNQCITKIGKHKYVLYNEWFDSTGTYKDIYGHHTSHGFSIYALHSNYILFMIEIGNNNGKKIMTVNYYLRHLPIPKVLPFEDDEFIEFIFSVANFFMIHELRIYMTYRSCGHLKVHNHDEEKCNCLYREGTYCDDIYEYLKHGKKRFANFTTVLAKCDYALLDLLSETKPSTVIQRSNRDDILYQLFRSVYQKDDNLKNFYLWLISTNCSLLPNLIKKFDLLFQEKNPFNLDYYEVHLNFPLNKKRINKYRLINHF